MFFYLLFNIIQQQKIVLIYFIFFSKFSHGRLPSWHQLQPGRSALPGQRTWWGQIWPVKILKWHASKLILGSPISILRCFFHKKIDSAYDFQSGCKKMWGKTGPWHFCFLFRIKNNYSKKYKYYQSIVYLNTIIVHKNFNKNFHN